MSEPAPAPFSSSGAEKDSPKQRLLRLGFLLLLAGGLVLWTQLRKPRELVVELDLAAALPGEVSEVDLIVRRGERLLVRKDLKFENGASQILSETFQATPGAAEIEADVIYRDHRTVRTRADVKLAEGAPARVVLEPAR